MFPSLPSLRGLRPRKFGLVSWSEHVPFAFDLVAELRPRLLVELGTHSGESYFAFCQSVLENNAGTSCYAVDTWKGDEQAGFYSEDVYLAVARHNQEFYRSFSYLVRATFDEAVAQFADGTIDLLHIDGLHTYAAVKHDFETWLPKVSAGGIVLFHDVVARHGDFGAWRFWEELVSPHGSFTFHHGWGLGVWRKDSTLPLASPFLQSLFSGEPSEAENIRRYYSLAADNLRLQTTNRQLRALVPPDLLAGAGSPPAEDAPAGGESPFLQVYFPRDGSYHEAASTKVALETGQWLKLAIALPTDWRGAPLRLDPLSAAGLIEIASLRVASRLFDHTVWMAEGRTDLLALPVQGTARLLSDERFLRLLSFDGDPQIFTPAINCEAFEEPLELEISLRIRTDWPALAKVLAEWARQLDRLPALEAQAGALEAELGAVRGEHVRAVAGLEAAEQRTAELSSALTASWQFLSALQSELPQQEARARTLAEQLEHLRAALAASQDQLQEAHGLLRAQRQATRMAEEEAAALAADVAGLENEVAAEQERRRLALAALREAEAELDHARHERRADHGRVLSMRNSGSWKLTLPLRVLHRSLTGRKRAPAGANGAASSANGAHPPAEASSTATNGLPGLAEHPPRYAMHIDEPPNWHLASRQVRVRGWYLALEPTATLASLAARWGEQTAAARLHLARPDVAAHHLKSGQQDFHCGFELDLDLPAGPSQVVLTATNASGQSWSVGQFEARAPYGLRAQRAAAVDPALDYTRWVELYDTLDAAALGQLRAQTRALPYQPLISVVMPTYNTPSEWLAKAIDSVRHQVYANWELCIADDASTDPAVRATLARYAATDPRIKVCYRERNGHISAASNSALELAAGEFVALLDHDDELAAHALSAVALELNLHPDADLIYSDEDKIDEEGRRFDAYFKPDWNPELLTGQNYISHLGVYRADRLRQAGGFRVGFEGCQDWDLALRVSEATSAAQIRHISRVLYHWRAIAGSTARALGEKDYIADSSARAVREHCERTGQAANLQSVEGSHWRILRMAPAPAPLVSVIIPTRNQVTYLRRCVESVLQKTTYYPYEIVIVDNGSDDPETLAYLQTCATEGDARVLRYDQPFNYSAINNYAVTHAAGDYVCLLNNDVEVITPDWLDEMVGQALRPEIGAVGAMLYYPNDTIQHAGVVLGIGGVAGHIFSGLPRGTHGYFNRARLVQEMTAVTAACLLVCKSLYQEVGGLDERLGVAFNDVDFCLKLRQAGHRNIWTPFAELYHHESASRGRRILRNGIGGLPPRWSACGNAGLK